MTKLSPEWVRTSDPVIRSPACYRWTTAPAWMRKEISEIWMMGQSRIVKGILGWTGVILLFRAVMTLVHDWAEWSVWTGTVSGYCRTITWEVGYLRRLHPPCDVDLHPPSTQGIHVPLPCGGHCVVCIFCHHTRLVLLRRFM